MCQQFEQLIVCCSENCTWVQHGVRLPLLRLIPKPDPIYILCDRAIQMGYRPETNCVGVLGLSYPPVACTDYLAHPDHKSHSVLSVTASRHLMEAFANIHILCAVCLGIGHADAVPTANPTARLHTGRGEANGRNMTICRMADGRRRIEVEWTCCASGDCSQDRMCYFRGSATLAAHREIENQRRRERERAELEARNIAAAAQAQEQRRRNMEREQAELAARNVAAAALVQLNQPHNPREASVNPEPVLNGPEPHPIPVAHRQPAATPEHQQTPHLNEPTVTANVPQAGVSGVDPARVAPPAEQAAAQQQEIILDTIVVNPLGCNGCEKCNFGKNLARRRRQRP
ncbi:hypothetical protein CkaCkLH20_09993 [Colletotrichum karsti]|uniref:Uncharacterized protein n=1 Tax=Colletotrichum karsti TaxID=1095194 RepID=A0A9P6I1V5_9PEZI|nr:uncharacterized protein CkaCkLH20_09993 [Colletotrichum karsti]KAF9872496.1 hypothetical protein CkaCkLH20_09993 [Colletotrichum karsti]